MIQNHNSLNNHLLSTINFAIINIQKLTVKQYMKKKVNDENHYSLYASIKSLKNLKPNKICPDQFLKESVQTKQSHTIHFSKDSIVESFDHNQIDNSINQSKTIQYYKSEMEMYKSMALRFKYQIQILNEELNYMKKKSKQELNQSASHTRCEQIFYQKQNSELTEGLQIYKKIAKDLEQKVKDLVIVQKKLADELKWFMNEMEIKQTEMSKLEQKNEKLEIQLLKIKNEIYNQNHDSENWKHLHINQEKKNILQNPNQKTIKIYKLRN